MGRISELVRYSTPKADRMASPDRKDTTLKLMSTLAVAVAFRQDILPAFTAASGVTPEVIWGPTTALQRRIAGGERADAIVMIDGAMQALVEAGLIRAGSVRPLARSLVGLAVAAGAPRPDISTPAKLRDALIRARAVAYSRGGASGIFFARLIRELGIAEAVEARAVIIPEGFTAERLLTGEADLAVQQVSELMSVAGVDIVGPLPEGAQEGIDLSVGVFVGADDSAAAFVAAATSPEAARAYRQSGLLARF
jgi:molybdate transport system substrate-binding protein